MSGDGGDLVEGGNVSAISKVPGSGQLKEWFGYIPTFHDAEVVGLDLRRGMEPSTLQVHVWRTSDKTDGNGYFQRDRHATVSFLFSNIVRLAISEWNHQNVLASLGIEEGEEGYVITLNGTFGVDGEIVAKLLNVKVEPRSPVLVQTG